MVINGVQANAQEVKEAHQAMCRLFDNSGLDNFYFTVENPNYPTKKINFDTATELAEFFCAVADSLK